MRDVVGLTKAQQTAFQTEPQGDVKVERSREEIMVETNNLEKERAQTPKPADTES